jgi:phosphate-selective porin OprO/OprP
MKVPLPLKVMLATLAVFGLAIPAQAAEGEAEEDPNGVKVSLGAKGLRFETNDGAFKFKIGGRIHVDAAANLGDLPDDPSGFGSVDPSDGIEIRRGRIHLAGTVFEDWDFISQVDFADDEVAIKDMLVSYNGFDWGRFTIGNQKQPYSEALEMSSNDLPFVERGIDNELVVPFTDRALGLRFDGSGEMWHVALGVFGQGIDATAELDEGWGVAGRAVIAPIRNENSVLHIGFRSAYREPEESVKSAPRLRTETTHFSRLFISNTLRIPTRAVTMFGPEAAYAYGPFSIFGEYNRSYLKTVRGMQNLSFQSGHVAATWSLTGESRAASYKMASSEFGALKPAENFSLKKRTWGAFELSTRYAYIDVTDKNVRGGQEGRMSTGLNWYLNPAVRMMADWTRVLNAKNGSVVTNSAKGLDIFTYRLQIAF